MKLKQFVFAFMAMLLCFSVSVNAQVAKVGDTEYATLDEAIAAWSNNSTLTLLADVTLSDVVTLKSTEHHILNLGTYTMTAASSKNAFVIQACGTGSAERTAITINADATNPGGINAGSKCVVYYKYADGGISTEDRPIIKINGGVFTGSTSSFGTYGIYTIGTAARKCATLNISGGTFNCSIYGSGKSKLIVSGGVFNYSVGSQGDSTASRLISGGTFKSFGFMTADSNNTKFWIGTSMGNSNVGAYIDDNGYLVVGGPVVTEPGTTFEASSPNIGNAGFGSYLTYSSAATNGIYYTSVEEALTDNNKNGGSVTVHVDELDMADFSSYKGTIVVPEGNDITITNAPSTLKVQLADGTVLTPDSNGTVATKLEVATLAELRAALASTTNVPIVITAQIEIPAGETVELDLNGKTVNSVFNGNSTTNHIYALSNKGTLTIKDSKDNGSINSRGIYNYGSLTLNAGAINAIDGNGGYAVNNQSGSTFVMNGGVVAASYEDDHQNSSGGYDATALKVPADCTTTLNGGTINNVCDFTFAIDAAGTLNIPATSTITVNGTHGAIAVSGGVTTIDAGTYTIPADNYNRTDNVLYVTGGSLVINGGTFIGDSDTTSGGSCLCDEAGTAVVNGGTFKGSSGGDVWGTTGTTIKGGTFENLTEKKYIADGYELGADGTVKAKPVAEVNGVKYYSFAEAAAAAQAGSEIKLLANIEGDITVPANVTLNGNGFAISGTITADGTITFAGVTKAGNFGVKNVNTVVNIPAGASLQLTGSGRMVIGHGCTFNITGSIADNAAKTADKATLTPSLVMPGASFTGAGVTFNVTNAYISAPSSYCSSSKSASGTFDFNITNSIWDSAGKLAFEAQSTAAKVDFALVNSVLTTGSHLVFATASGEEGVVIDNSLVNQGTSRQIENRGTMTIKNGAVVNGAVATSSNAINPGTIIVENATYAVTGEFSGAAVGTGNLIIKKGANVSVGSIKAGANVTVDAEGMTAGDEINFTADLSQFTGTLSVINNDKLEASIVDGKVVLAAKPVAQIGTTSYATLEEAFKAANAIVAGCTIDILSDVTVDYNWDARYTGGKFTVPVTINGNGKTIKFTASVNDNNYQAPFRFEKEATVNNLTVDMSEVTDVRFRAISSKDNLTVDGCKFIGKDETLNCRAIIFGEGAGTNVGNLAIAIKNSEFINWKRGITDNENAQDVKTVTITDNTLTDAGVVVSAKETVTFTGNTVSGAYVNIKSYTAGNKLAVTATGNTLEANTETAYNVINAGGKVEADDAFNVVAKGNNFNGYTSTDGIWGEVWGNARESFVIKVLDANGNVMGTTSLNNVGGIIDGDVNVSWNLKFNAAANTDEYWTMAWTTAPTLDNMPAKVELWVDGTKVSGGDVVLNGPDDLNKIYVIVTDAEGKITSCQTTVANALAAAKDGETVTILAGDFTQNLDVQKTITVAGETDAEGNNLVNFAGKLNITADGATVKNINVNNGGSSAGYINAKNVTVDNCQVVGGNGFRNCYTKGTVTFKNSVITGSTYGIHFDGSANGNIVIDNCTITGWTSFASTITKVTMKDTRFDKGNYNYVRFYQGAELTGCSFNEEMNVDLAVDGVEVTVADCTVDGDRTVEDLFDDKDIANSSITIDDVKLARIAKIGDEYYATFEEAFKAAKAGDTVTILAGTYPVPAMKAGITVEGEGEVLLEGTLSGTLENLTLKNLHIKGGNAQRWAYGKGDLVFENVTFEATSVYALHFDGITAGTNLTYKNCTIIGWAAMGGSPASCVFDGCTIKGNGTYGVIRTYFDTTIENCTFDVANVSTTDAYEDGIHAVEGAEVVVDNCTNANGDMKDIVNVHGASVVTVDGVEIKNAAKAGNKYYATFEEAFAAVQAGETLTLLADLNLSDILTINKAITFDGNGKTLTSSAGRAINVSGAEANAVKANAVKANAVKTNAVKTNGVKIQNLTINASGERAINVIQNATNVTIDNVTATAANYTVNVAASAPNAVVAIKNSTLNGLCTVNVAAAGAQVTVDNSTVNCNDNNTTAGESYAALCLNKDAVGGSIVATNSTINVTEGSDSMKGRNGAENGTVTINGSTDGVTVMVAVITYEGSTNYYSFATLADAVEFAKTGDVITLLRDVTVAEKITIAKSITLDGNGKTLIYTGNGTSARAIDVPAADGVKLEVTIKNLTVDCTSSYCQRGINYNEDGKLTLEGVTVKGTYVTYALNLPGSSDNCEVAINNSSLTGNIALNVWGENSVINAENTVFTAVDNNTVEGYAAVKLNNDGTTSAEGTVINITGGKIDVTGSAAEDTEATSNATSTGKINISDSTIVNGMNAEMVAVIRYADGNSYSFMTIEDAIAKAQAGETVTLLRDITASNIITINKAITLDLNGKKVTSTAKKAFEVYANATIKNGAIEAAQRCVDTRKAVELTLTNVTLIADEYTTHGNPQPLTIGGSENGTKVVMTNVDISAAAGYGIITFVETELTATNSTIGGYNALYVKPGSDNSVFNFVDSDLSGSTVGNDVEGNSFSVIAVRANNVTVNVDAASTVTAAGNYSYAISFKSKSDIDTPATGSSVTVAGTITGNILADLNGNTVKVKAEYADELAAAGYATIEAENGLVAAIKAVAKIGDTRYASLAAAITAAQANDVITFVNDITENVTISKNVTIDGANKKYTGTMTGDAGLNVTVQNVNFVNGGFAKTTKSTTGSYTIKDCTFDGAGTYAYPLTIKGANTVNVENCTVKNYQYGFLYVSSGTNSVSVKDVTVDNCPSYAVYFGSGVNKAMFENLTVKNSNNGFIINNTANRTFTMKNCVMENVTTAINHSNGTNTITCTALGVNDLGTAALSEYAVIKGATIEGSTLYGSVQSMVEKAEDNQTVQLLSDITLDATGYEMASCDGYPSFVHVEGKAITVDLNGKTIGADVDAGDVSEFVVGVFSTDNGGELTLVDSSTEGTGKVILDAEDGKVYSLLCNYEDGCKMTINGGTYVANKVRDCLVYSGGKTDALVTVNGGNFTLGNVGVGENGKPWIFNVLGAGDHHVLVNGGTFNADINRQHWSNEVVVPETHYTVANADSTAFTVNEGAVAYVNEGMLTGPYFIRKNIGYATLAEAIAEVDTDETVTLLKDVTLDDALVVEEGMDVTINGEGKTITGCDGKDVFYVKGGKLTLTEGLNVHATTDCAIYLRGGDVFTAANLTKSGDKYSVIQGNGNYAGNVTITGGKVETSDNLTAIYWPQNGKLTITGGEITGHSAVYIASGSLEITGGKLHGVGANGSYEGVTGGSANAPGEALTIENVGGNSGYEEISSVVISGGEFISDNAKAVGSYANTTLNPEAKPVAGFISGGTFSSALEASYCAEGYGPYAFEDGTFGVESLNVDDITIVDGAEDEFVNQNEKTVGTLTYKRSNIKNTWTPFYVPFAVPVSELPDDFDVAYINAVRRRDGNSDGVLDDDFTMEIIFIHCESKGVDGSGKILKPNYPYFIRSKSESGVEMNITLNNAVLYAAKENVYDCTTMTEKFEIKGNYHQIPSDDFDENDYVVGGGVWGNITAGYPLNPFRFYMTRSSRDGSDPTTMAPLKSMKIVVCGEEDENGATIIYDVVEDSLNGDDFIYDLQGRRVSEPKKGGIYIKNGKKILY